MPPAGAELHALVANGNILDWRACVPYHICRTVIDLLNATSVSSKPNPISSSHGGWKIKTHVWQLLLSQASYNRCGGFVWKRTHTLRLLLRRLGTSAGSRAPKRMPRAFGTPSSSPRWVLQGYCPRFCSECFCEAYGARHANLWTVRLFRTSMPSHWLRNGPALSRSLCDHRCAPRQAAARRATTSIRTAASNAAAILLAAGVAHSSTSSSDETVPHSLFRWQWPLVTWRHEMTLADSLIYKCTDFMDFMPTLYESTRADLRCSRTALRRHMSADWIPFQSWFPVPLLLL